MRETQVWSLGQEDSPGEGNGCPLQYSCLENSTDRGARQATVHRVTKSWIQLSDFHFTWTIFKVFIAFVTILLLIFMFWGFCLVWDQTHTPGIRKWSLNHSTARNIMEGSWLKLFKIGKDIAMRGIVPGWETGLLYRGDSILCALRGMEFGYNASRYSESISQVIGEMRNQGICILSHEQNAVWENEKKTLIE